MTFINQNWQLTKQINNQPINFSPVHINALGILFSVGHSQHHGGEHHEWFCPVAISELAAMAADRPKSRSQSSLSRKSSSSSRKSSAPPLAGITAGQALCKLRMVLFS